jgi:VCBS repeat protein
MAQVGMSLADRAARVFKATALIAATLLLSSSMALAQFVQRGPPLVGAGGVGTPQQGTSVAVSADGNTAIVGGPQDGSAVGPGTGAAWVYTRSGGVWTQQGNKLVANDGTGASGLGTSVALSADGNTAVLGGPNDNSGFGAAWVFTRSGGVWTQQGSKLAAIGGVGASGLGSSVALSGEGNTAIFGGPNDNSGAGAAWVFTRSGGVWTQLGDKLVGAGAAANASQGTSVALSGDGNTASVGAPNGGGVWVFTRSGDVWTQQGNELTVPGGMFFTPGPGHSVALSADGNTVITGGDATGRGPPPTVPITPFHYFSGAWIFIRSSGIWTLQSQLLQPNSTPNANASVAVSADGNTAILGVSNDSSGIGAAWVYTRSSGGSWTQLGNKLVGSGNTGASEQGTSVALSADAKTAFIGGPNGNGGIGAAWVFVSTGNHAATHDFNADGRSDIAWRDTGGNAAIWLMSGGTVLSASGIGMVPTTWSIAGQRDFDGEGNADLLWHDTSGNTAIWFMNGTTVLSAAPIGIIPTTWGIIATGDFNGDGFGDILWQDNSGNLAVWLMNGATVSSSAGIGNVPLGTWTVVGTGDFDGDGKTDLLWRDTSGNTAIWFMNGTAVSTSALVGNVPTTWSVAGTGDFNGDGKSDIVWHDTSGNTAMWLMNGATVSSAAGLGVVAATWSIVQTGDYDGDGRGDLLWTDTSGNLAIWFMNGMTVSSTAGLGSVTGTWTVQSANAE